MQTQKSRKQTTSCNSGPSLSLKKSQLNVSGGGVFYEKAKSRRQRYRLALMSSGDSVNAIPLGKSRKKTGSVW